MNTIKCKVERGQDGWNRILVNMFDYVYTPGDEIPSFKLMRLAKEQTGVDWEWFGCMMDVGCLATRADVGDEITLNIES